MEFCGFPCMLLGHMRVYSCLCVSILFFSVSNCVSIRVYPCLFRRVSIFGALRVYLLLFVSIFVLISCLSVSIFFDSCLSCHRVYFCPCLSSNLQTHRYLRCSGHPKIDANRNRREWTRIVKNHTFSIKISTRIDARPCMLG